MAYRGATGDEKVMVLFSSFTVAAIYEFSNAGSAPTFELRSQTNHAAGTTKSLGAGTMSAAGSQLALMMIDDHNAKQAATQVAVAKKPANKAGRPAAERVEPRAGTKGNTSEPRTRRTQSRESV